MKFLHLSDIHFVTITLNPTRLLSKRGLGMTNLLVNRQFHYKEELLKPILDKVSAVDQVWITGDLTTTSMEEEFEQALRFLDTLSEKEKEIILIPGNHDRYTKKAFHEKRYEQKLERYLKERDSFPFVQHLSDSLVLIGLDGTMPLGLLSSSGRLSEDQYEKLEEILQDPDIQAKRIVVLCHFPIVYPEGFTEAESHKLIEKERLNDLLTRYNVSLYLHGHTHHQWILPAKKENPLIVNAGSATKKKLGGYVIFEIEPEKIKIYPFQHYPKEGWKAEPIQEYPFLPAKERQNS